MQKKPSFLQDSPFPSIIDTLNQQCVKIEAWFRQQWQETPPPFYGSVDIRNAGFKITEVDNNLFPAGFNNLDPTKMPLYIQALQATIAEICPDVTKLLLIPESHTRNSFYLENVSVLHNMLIQAGFEVHIGNIDASVLEPLVHQLPSGKSLLIEPVSRKDDKINVNGFVPCLIILNNDLSSGIPAILENLQQSIMPALTLGWVFRSKSQHFHYYDKICTTFAQTIGTDPWFMMPYFEKCMEIDFKNQVGLECLAVQASSLLEKIQRKYAEYNIKHQPFIVVKADQGTYGMAVMMIDNPEYLIQLNRKDRNKMGMIKGGRPVNKVIIQEGVHTFETVGVKKSVAEPVIYTIGRYVIGGFYRVHQQRGPRENLNAPGMNFEPLHFKHPCHLTQPGCKDPRYYAYGVIARLAQLAASHELKNSELKFDNKEVIKND